MGRRGSGRAASSLASAAPRAPTSQASPSTTHSGLGRRKEQKPRLGGATREERAQRRQAVFGPATGRPAVQPLTLLEEAA
eukprot:5398641-Alexandrium_andersonii.AAC.1